jgi:sugar (pentulose or hexulose) kinase
MADALGAPVEGLAEPESAALGAAVQALWTARRASGEACSADEVAGSFVRTTGEGAEPDPAGVRALREARERLVELVGRHFRAFLKN